MAGELERLLIRLEADTTQLRRALSSSEKDVSKFADNTERHATRVAGSFKAMLAAAGTGYAVREFARLADQYSNMENRLKAITKSAAEFEYVQKGVYAAAQETRIGVAEVNELYARLAFSLKDVGVSTNEVLELTETLSKATVVSGASQAEAAGALRQLSQAMASGVLRGQELNSVMEQLPVVADMIAKHMGITIGQLRKMAEEGRLTSKVVRDSILASQDEIAEKFAKTNPTIAQSFDKMNNALVFFAGALDDSVGFSNALAAALTKVAGSLELATKHMREARSVWSDASGGGSLWEGLASGESIWAGAATQRRTGQFASGGLNGAFGAGRFAQPGIGSASFDPNAKGQDRTPAALDPWAASIIPPTYQEQMAEMKEAWDQLHEAQLMTLDDLIGDKTETAAAKMAALTAAVKEGSITWSDFGSGVKDVQATTERANESMLSSTANFLDTMFANNKTAATASALINTYQGITKALASYPPPYSYAMAAMQAAMGFAQVRSIQSTSKNSSGGGASVAGGASSAAGAAGGGGGLGNVPSNQTLTVRGLEVGELLDHRSLRNLLERIRDMQSDGYRLVV